MGNVIQNNNERLITILKVYDNQGKIILSKETNFEPKLKIDLSNNPNGIYHIVAIDTSGKIVYGSVNIIK